MSGDSAASCIVEFFDGAGRLAGRFAVADTSVTTVFPLVIGEIARIEAAGRSLEVPPDAVSVKVTLPSASSQVPVITFVEAVS